MVKYWAGFFVSSEIQWKWLPLKFPRLSAVHQNWYLEVGRDKVFSWPYQWSFFLTLSDPGPKGPLVYAFIGIFLKSTCQKLVNRFENNVAQQVLRWLDTKSVAIIETWWKLWLPWGGHDIFSYTYIGKVKN